MKIRKMLYQNQSFHHLHQKDIWKEFKKKKHFSKPEKSCNWIIEWGTPNALWVKNEDTQTSS